MAFLVVGGMFFGYWIRDQGFIVRVQIPIQRGVK